MSYEYHKYYNGNLYANVVNDVKNQQLFMRPIYVGITYLKWPYGNYNRKDVSIAQCSF
jgi:hypothetical protein